MGSGEWGVKTNPAECSGSRKTSSWFLLPTPHSPLPTSQEEETHGRPPPSEAIARGHVYLLDRAGCSLFQRKQDPTENSGLIQTSATEVVDEQKGASGKDVPLRDETLLRLGMTYYEAAKDNQDPISREQQIQMSRKNLNALMARNTKNFDALIYLARLSTLTGDRASAYAYYDKATHLKPNQADLMYEMARCHIKFGEWDPAIHLLELALKTKPDSSVYRMHLGITMILAGRTDEGYSFLEKGMPPARAHYCAASAFLYLKRPEQAREHLMLALKADPNFEAATQMLTQMNSPQGTAVPQALPDSIQDLGNTPSGPVDVRPTPVSSTMPGAPPIAVPHGASAAIQPPEPAGFTKLAEPIPMTFGQNPVNTGFVPLR